jgi:four helix bundle protein
MTTIKRFEDIEAWKSARELAVLAYQLTNQEKFCRDFGLRDQIRRAAVSVMSNIAEGYESRTKQAFINYLGHSKASAGEVRSQAYVAFDVGYINQEQFDLLLGLAEKCSRQVARFIEYLAKDIDRPV